MTVFTTTQSGNTNDGATFGNNSPGVAGVDYPGSSADSIVNGVFEITVPDGVTLSCGAISLTGTSNSNRSILTLGTNAQLTMNAVVTMNEYHTFNKSPGSVLDLNGNNVELTQDGGANNLNEWNLIGSAANPWVIKCSVGNTGQIIRTTGWGQPIRCNLYAQYGAMISIGGWHIGTNNWADGINLEFYDIALTDCGTIVLGSDMHVNNIFKVKRIDCRGTPSGPSSPAGRFMDLAQGTSGASAANIDVSHITIKGDTGTEEIRFNGFKIDSYNMILDMVKHTRIIDGPHIISKSFLKLIADNSIGIGNKSGFDDEAVDCITYGGHDNPHALGGSVVNVRGGYIELNYDEEPHTDAGDTFIVIKGTNMVFENVAIRDSEGGAMLNALDTPAATATYTFKHCTVISKMDVYGFHRDESGGSFTGTIHNESNIFYNTGAFANSRGFNLAVTSSAIINSKNNVWWNVDDIYFSVQPQSFTTADELTDQPTFHQLDDRKLEDWAVTVGEAKTSQAAIDYMLEKVNGYNSVTKKQDTALKNVNSVIYPDSDPDYPGRLKAEVWCREGLTVTTPQHQNSGLDGKHRGIEDDAPVASSVAVNGSGVGLSMSIGIGI